LQVGHLGENDEGGKRAFLQIQPVIFVFGEDVRAHVFYWAAVVMERDGNNGPMDSFEIDRENINTAWVDTRLPDSDATSRVSHDELLRVADVTADAPERPIVFTRDAERFRDSGLPRPYIVLHNPDCPNAETGHPTRDEHCPGVSNGPDDIVAMVGAGRIQPAGEPTVSVHDVKLHFPDDDIPAVPKANKEYYVMFILYDRSDDSVGIFRSPITFSDIH
jgi:hypothetical protein